MHELPRRGLLGNSGVMVLGGDRKGFALHVSLAPSTTKGRYRWI